VKSKARQKSQAEAAIRRRSSAARRSAGAQQPDAGLTRAAVARLLGRTTGSVRFHEGKTLHPRRDDDGVWRFDRAEVEALASKLGRERIIEPPVAELSPGKLAARVCTLFRDGKSVVDVVIALEQPFDVVQQLHRAFLDDSGAMYVPALLAERMAVICEVDKVTPEVVLQALETNSQKLAEMSAARHGATLSVKSPRKT
jgi:hypothetical protein